jgi:urea transporter/murein DD-endopeptidase MepM/ murein hydrolase activator NlpD
MKYWVNSILNSYGQIFYSMNKVLSALVLIATFFSPNLGLSGLCAIVFTNVVGHVIGINRKLIEEGLYGFNSLLLGLFLAYQYEINSTFILLFVVSLALLLIISVWLFGIFSRHGLPFLSFPFIITYCIISMSAGSFTNVLLNEDLVYVGNHIARQQGTYVYQLAHSLDDLVLPNAVLIYLKTLAGTFFQTSLLAGILIASGLLYFSRIAFSLSLLGFFSAYFFYSAFGADVNELNLNLVGSNFIFMAIGIGCFYIVPNSYSYLAVFCLTPILIMLMIFLNKVMFVFQLKSFTLSFSVIISLFLLFLQHRWFHQFLHLVTIQYYSAEKTIYKYITSINRFKNEHLAKIQLPFWGDWYVSQGYNGKITHLGDWGKALDFVIVDESNETYQNNGHKREDYYCYNKPVLAPLDGYIYSILNTVEENEIAGVNTVDNWGNTLVMNHLNGTFSQISHVKKDSFKVSVGEYVTKGTVLATCGNSGRSPEPHIHFQLQMDPKVGAKTIEYPVSYFIEKENSKQILRVSEVPKQDTVISNVEVNSLLSESFAFLPGHKVRFIEEKTAEVVEWEVFTDQWNRKYIYCQQTKSVAYFVNDGTMFYFFDFEGTRKSLLFHFYLASYRVLLGCHEGVQVNDLIPLIHFNNKVVQILQDFVAPFYLFTKAEYQSSYIQVDNVHDPSVATLKSSVEAKFINLRFRKIEFEIKLSNKNIHQFSFSQNGILKTYVCIK